MADQRLEPTPGPWGWTYDGSKDYSIGEADDPQVNPVAHVYAWQRNYDKAAANCALIAASPDLLAALKDIREHCPCDPDINPRWQAAWDAMDAAIALAEGGNHFQ